jgi:hypothetical protein
VHHSKGIAFINSTYILRINWEVFLHIRFAYAGLILNSPIYLFPLHTCGFGVSVLTYFRAGPLYKARWECMAPGHRGKERMALFTGTW